MQVTSITEFRTDPGTYLEWPVSLGVGEPSDVPPSFNQSFHLSPVLSGPESSGVPVWIAVAFDVTGPVDVDAMTWAFTRFAQRHAALRTTFRARGSALERLIHDPAGISVGPPSTEMFDESAGLGAHLRSRFDELCHPARSPSYCFAAVDREDRSTVLCAFDHAHVDAVSMAVAADELCALYDARRSDGTVALDDAGSFVDFCAEEAATPEVPATDTRIRAWSDFVAGCGGSTPSFPFDLGVLPGDDAPQATTVVRLTTAESTERFELRCRELGAGMFASIAAALAQAVADIGGPSTLPLLFPLHTRRDPRWAGAVGWFTTNAPMVVNVGGEFVETLASAHASFRAALPLGTVPIPRVLGALGSAFTRTRQDVFMISYVDYRTLPGGDALDRAAHHISNVTTADDAQFWITRTADGLALRSRFPDTPRGREVIAQFASRLAAVMQEEATATASSYDRPLVAPTTLGANA